jgi:hypothetical protein
MNRQALVVAGAVLAVACSSCRFSTNRTVADSPDPFVRAAEVEKKRQSILDEIERLGPDHPWAGVYYGYRGVPVSLVAAPEGGCVTTIFGCFGLRDSQWSPVDATLALGTCAFSADNVCAHLVAFGETFVLVADGTERNLQADDGAVYRRQPVEAVPFEKRR